MALLSAGRINQGQYDTIMGRLGIGGGSPVGTLLGVAAPSVSAGPSAGPMSNPAMAVMVPGGGMDVAATGRMHSDFATRFGRDPMGYGD